MRFIHVLRCNFLSCLLPKCADNTWFKIHKYFFWPVACLFFFVHFLVARLDSMRISFVWVCACLLRANVIDTVLCMVWKIVQYSIWTSKNRCTSMSMGAREKNWVRARQIVWLVQCSSLCHAIDIPTNTGRCVVDRIFKYFSFARSLFCYNIHSVFIFRGADKRI